MKKQDELAKMWAGIPNEKEAIAKIASLSKSDIQFLATYESVTLKRPDVLRELNEHIDIPDIQTGARPERPAPEPEAASSNERSLEDDVCGPAMVDMKKETALIRVLRTQVPGPMIGLGSKKAFIWSERIKEEFREGKYFRVPTYVALHLDEKGAAAIVG